jgi:hypothetical protein
MQTSEFKLVTGIEMEVRPMEGSHIRTLTKGNKLATGQGLREVLKDCTVRIGSKRSITDKDIHKIWSADRKKALVKIRQLSCNFNPLMKFSYKWDAEDIRDLDIEAETEHELQLQTVEEMMESGKDEFIETPYRTLDGNPIYFKELTDLDDYYTELKLNMSGDVVRFKFLAGEAEERAVRTNKNDRDALLAIDLRSPQKKFVTDKKGKEGNVSWISLNVNKMALPDIEQLGKAMKLCEGTVDTSMVIRHPKNTNITTTVDLIQQKSFFFLGGIL